MEPNKPTTDQRERRQVDASLEIRAVGEDEGGQVAKGYACLFDNETDIGGYWLEKFAPGAFAKSLGEPDVVALHSHDGGRPVGRKSRGTLRIAEDQRGLAFENDLPDTQDGRDLSVQIDRGDIEAMSFAFRAVKEEWDETGDTPLRTVLEAELYEITYTAFPAYPDTSVGKRSLEHSRQERREHNKAGACTRISARRARQAHAERGIRPE